MIYLSKAILYLSITVMAIGCSGCYIAIHWGKTEWVIGFLIIVLFAIPMLLFSVWATGKDGRDDHRH